MPTIEVSLNGLRVGVEAGIRLDVFLDNLREGAGLNPSLVAVGGHYVAPEAWCGVVLREGSNVDTIE